MFKDLRDFIVQLEQRGALKRIQVPISPVFEMTEVCNRTLHAKGPALLFRKSTGFNMPMLGNPLGTPERVALDIGAEDIGMLHEIGKSLAQLKELGSPRDLKDAWVKLPMYGKALSMTSRALKDTPCQEVVGGDEDVDLGRLSVQTYWPGDVGSLITWSLTVTRGPNKEQQNLGIYRQQVIGRSKAIMRQLSHRGGAPDYRKWRQRRPGQPYPVAATLGADLATIPGMVTPVPDTLSKYTSTSLLCGHYTELVKCRGGDLQVPANAETVLEGVTHPGEVTDEGPYGDHTGYYNEVDRFPVFTVERIARQQRLIYRSTYTGCPPDGPAILGVALNEVSVPILQRQFPEIVDFYLPPEGCSYRMVVVTTKEQHPGHAKCMMFGT